MFRLHLTVRELLSLELPQMKRRSAGATDLDYNACDLTTKLEQALTDTYKRQASKKARHQPSPNKKPLKPPIVVLLTPKERSKIEKMNCEIAA